MHCRLDRMKKMPLSGIFLNIFYKNQVVAIEPILPNSHICIPIYFFFTVIILQAISARHDILNPCELRFSLGYNPIGGFCWGNEFTLDYVQYKEQP